VCNILMCFSTFMHSLKPLICIHCNLSSWQLLIISIFPCLHVFYLLSLSLVPRPSVWRPGDETSCHFDGRLFIYHHICYTVHLPNRCLVSWYWTIALLTVFYSPCNVKINDKKMMWVVCHIYILWGPQQKRQKADMYSENRTNEEEWCD